MPVAVPVLAAAYATAVVVGPRFRTDVVTAYRAASAPLAAADLAGGLALLTAGVLAWFERQSRRAAALALVTGAAWFGADWEGWDGGPTLVRSVGALAAPFVLAFAFHLVIGYPDGRLRGPLLRAAVGAAYTVALVVAVGRALFRDPFLDPYCWRNCTENAFLVHADSGVAQALDDVWLRAAVAIGVLLVAGAAARLFRAGATRRRMLWPLLIPGALVGAGEAAYAAALLLDPAENPDDAKFASLFVARSVSLALLALGLAWSVAQARRRRFVVSRLSSDLGDAPPPGKLEETLAAALGDPRLHVAYRLRGSRRFVNSDGAVVEPPSAGSGQTVTAITRNGEPVALVQHESLIDANELEREVGSAARLAVDNERLQAEVLAQLEELRASRSRIVETGDAERRRLERNLHDGAQQRLLAVSYDLRLARASAEAEGNSELASLLGSAVDEAQAALEELRELAQGIYPSILGEAGLAPALATLVDEAPLPVDLDATAERYGAPVETTAYRVVAGGIDDAVRREATHIAVAVGREGDQLVVTVRDDGEARGSQLVDVADRVGALGGVVDAGPTTLRAEIPCA